MRLITRISCFYSFYATNEQFKRDKTFVEYWALVHYVMHGKVWTRGKCELLKSVNQNNVNRNNVNQNITKI